MVLLGSQTGGHERCAVSSSGLTSALHNLQPIQICLKLLMPLNTLNMLPMPVGTATDHQTANRTVLVN